NLRSSSPPTAIDVQYNKLMQGLLRDCDSFVASMLANVLKFGSRVKSQNLVDCPQFCWGRFNGNGGCGLPILASAIERPASASLTPANSNMRWRRPAADPGAGPRGKIER